MVSSFDGYNYIVRLDRGERLSDGLREFFAQYPGIDGASVSGIGGAEQLELGYYDLNARQYDWRKFEGLYEITSLLGTFAMGQDGQLITHLHGTFADREFQSIGGHVKDLVVGGTCELFVHRTYQPLRRSMDPKTGLNILDLA